MQDFVQLFHALDRSTATRDKVAALAACFAQATPADAVWTLRLLAGSAPRRPVPAGVVRRAIAVSSGLPDWLIEETYAHVGDLAETAALLAAPADLDLTPASPSMASLAGWMEIHLPALRALEPEAQIARIVDTWQGLPADWRLPWTKLLTGGWRLGVSRALVVQALAQISGLPGERLSHRLSGRPPRTAADWDALLAPADTQPAHDQPYPFCLASPLETEVESLGACSDWLAEWKWDGIRAQLIVRAGIRSLWSRGEERLDGRFPELEAAASALPDGVWDGEILAWPADAAQPLPFTALQPRIQRRAPGKALLARCPVRFLAYDLLEWDGADQRERPLHQRRVRLEASLVGCGPTLSPSPLLVATDWSELAALRLQSRACGVEGLMLKQRDSAYRAGRRRGEWWKWKTTPFTVDAVLIYAQAGHGRRANLYTDYTFAVWSGARLVPFAKAYSGLSDHEIQTLDRWIKAHTRERFGPVRSVEAVQVFELAFEAIQLSKRHKSGIAVRFPRILRWRTDKTADQADRLEDLHALLARSGIGNPTPDAGD